MCRVPVSTSVTVAVRVPVEVTTSVDVSDSFPLGLNVMVSLADGKTVLDIVAVAVTSLVSL